MLVSYPALSKVSTVPAAVTLISKTSASITDVPGISGGEIDGGGGGGDGGGGDEADDVAEVPVYQRGRSSSTVTKEAAMWKQPWTDGLPQRQTSDLPASGGDGSSGSAVSSPVPRSPARLPPLPAQPKAAMAAPGSGSKKRSTKPSAKAVRALTTLSHDAHVAHAAVEAKAEPKGQAGAKQSAKGF